MIEKIQLYDFTKYVIIIEFDKKNIYMYMIIFLKKFCSRRGAKKKVISVPIIEGDGSRSKGEVYPPQDSWSWRKYGQKPIKGSPYPR